jgi:hypothetical protein
MRGAGHEDVLVVLQVPGNKAGAGPGERLQFFTTEITESTEGNDEKQPLGDLRNPW